ncbi:hypothetical protein VB834_17230 [Limnoraphis robusta Tam1]|uniref:Uncharacterized protein n=1 Tax=Limnoraphis robusta CCNP1315 TaxID=3110306 RepID=A0ABU5TYF5_9CYAN|nr:hypothetical protein [Limnoraphis robusta]MEA5495956.1 hypothetical protein [Limnoraphis robusta BA-68 BA1]MEA5519984.1 hypothetical protein [Limnoraphis robusta CCNP1315]MEA5540765.1 hypothetical protein [Limnoraphis robusta Tam1]MEA5544910.1 hypothetical protein [Limnoraphis robusta CCNP1324]
MKKLLLALLFSVCLLLSFATTPALAGVCDQTLNTGASTTTKVFWEDSAAYYGWSGGVITNDMYFNGCGTTGTIKVSMDDFGKLLKEGKLDGLRYIKKDSNGIAVRKVQGTSITSIPQEQFFDSTTLVVTGNR